jgi:hypothetical protein
VHRRCLIAAAVAFVGTSVATAALISSVKQHARAERAAPETSGLGFTVARAIDWLSARLPEEPFQPQLADMAASKLFWALLHLGDSEAAP